jgi:hypothetical protein
MQVYKNGEKKIKYCFDSLRDCCSYYGTYFCPLISSLLADDRQSEYLPGILPFQEIWTVYAFNIIMYTGLLQDYKDTPIHQRVSHLSMAML